MKKKYTIKPYATLEGVFFLSCIAVLIIAAAFSKRGAGLAVTVLFAPFSAVFIVTAVQNSKFVFVSAEGIEYTQKVYNDLGGAEEVVKVCPWNDIRIKLELHYGRGFSFYFRFNFNNDMILHINEERIAKIFTYYERRVEITSDTLNQWHRGKGKKYLALVKDHNLSYPE